MIGKIIHASLSDSIKSSMRPSQNYLDRHDFLVNHTIPLLLKLGVSASFFNAIMYSDLDFDRAFEGNSYSPKKNLKFNGLDYILDNPFPTGYEIALCLGHASIWNMCIELGESILVMEDDIMLKSEYLDNLRNAISNFQEISDPAILYLQSTDTCTPNPKNRLKAYNQSHLMPIGSLFNVDRAHSDWSGTAAYVVNVNGAKQLINRSQTVGLRTPDGFIHRAISENYLDVYIPQKYSEGILLHPDYS